MDGENWTTIESDPGVFTELIERLGVKGVEVTELWALDVEALQQLKPVYGLIFLFKWTKEVDDRPIDSEYESKGVFFAKQVINNACATQAILSILLNSPGIDVGPELSAFRDFSSDFTPELKGLAIGNSELIRTVHNDFHPPQAFAHEEEKDSSGDAFHFIAYVPTAAGLYELDGLKPGPIRLGDCTTEDWMSQAVSAIQSRIAKFDSAAIEFNLMAVIHNRAALLQQELAQEEAKAETLRAKISASGGGDGENNLEIDLGAVEGEVDRLKLALKMEEDKHQQWREDNLRRRTNYLPFAVELLRCLAEKDPNSLMAA